MTQASDINAKAPNPAAARESGPASQLGSAPPSETLLGAHSASHTLGPWHRGGRDGTIIYDARGWAVADAKVHHGYHEHGAAEANARLITAAPRMLSVLRDMEWSASVDMETGGYEDGCPMCGAAQTMGHNLECVLEATIRLATTA